MTGYREWRPTGPVGGLLECAWQARAGSDGAREQRVLPDGCMDLLVLDGRLLVAGPDTAAHTAMPAPGSVRTGLRFRPGVLPALLGVPADELRNRRVELADLPGPAEMHMSVPRDALDDRGGHLDGARVPGAHHEAIATVAPGAGIGVAREACGPGSVAALLVDTAARLAAAAGSCRRPLPAPLPRWALGALARGAATADVADRLGVTTRTLHRTCTATLGYGPSVARRVLRFRAAAALLHAGVAPADVAHRTGYADQPHLSREVRALAGVSPAVLAAG